MKIIIKILPLLLMLSLAGCRSDALYREPERQYLVSAVGFDREDEGLKVTLEVVIFSVGEAEGGIESRTFSGVGQTIKSALGSLSGEVSKKLLYGHCALIVLGETLTPEEVGEVLDFCDSENELPISSSLVSSPDAAALLACQSISTPVTGYDITGVIKQKSEDWGIGLSNRLYEVKGRRGGGKGCFALPSFRVSGGNEQQLYTFTGIRIYENDSPSLLFDLPEGALYSLLTGTYKSGTFYFETGGRIYQPDIKRATAAVRAEEDSGRLSITIKMKLRLYRGQSDKTDPLTLASALEERATEFFSSVRARSVTDIFELSSRVAGYDGGDIDEIYPEIDINIDIPES